MLLLLTIVDPANDRLASRPPKHTRPAHGINLRASDAEPSPPPADLTRLHQSDTFTSHLCTNHHALPTHNSRSTPTSLPALPLAPEAHSTMAEANFSAALATWKGQLLDDPNSQGPAADIRQRSTSPSSKSRSTRQLSSSWRTKRRTWLGVRSLPNRPEVCAAPPIGDRPLPTSMSSYRLPVLTRVSRVQEAARRCGKVWCHQGAAQGVPGRD